MDSQTLSGLGGGGTGGNFEQEILHELGRRTQNNLRERLFNEVAESAYNHVNNQTSSRSSVAALQRNLTNLGAPGGIFGLADEAQAARFQVMQQQQRQQQQQQQQELFRRQELLNNIHRQMSAAPSAASSPKRRRSSSTASTSNGTRTRGGSISRRPLSKSFDCTKPQGNLKAKESVVDIDATPTTSVNGNSRHANGKSKIKEFTTAPNLTEKTPPQNAEAGLKPSKVIEIDMTSAENEPKKDSDGDTIMAETNGKENAENTAENIDGKEVIKIDETEEQGANSDKDDKKESEISIFLLRAAQDSNGTLEEEENAANIIAESLNHSDAESGKRFSDLEAYNIIRVLKDTVTNDPTADSYFGEEEKEEVIPGFYSAMPTLPVEPNYQPKPDQDGNEQIIDPTLGQTPGNPMPIKDASRNVNGPIYIEREKEDFIPGGYTNPVDTWWPSNHSLRREKKAQRHNNSDNDINERITNALGGKTTITKEMHERLSNEIEPGVLEKIPHCKVYERLYRQEHGRAPKEPLFCFQVSEIYCNSIMLCCSKCSTWRHAECGGHYERYSPQSIQEEFTPTCTICHKEEGVVEKYPLAIKRIDRQRTIHLRKAYATSAIMKQAGYAKHGGTYKWPLGSVSATHIGGHTKSVHIRHDRSEKQWKEMASKLGQGNYRSKDRVKMRTKEFERLVLNLEDAGTCTAPSYFPFVSFFASSHSILPNVLTEATTDRHNMTLFLHNDTMQKYPAGFEKPRLNFFDPAEDIQRDYEKLEREEEEVENKVDEESVHSKSENNGKRYKRNHDLDMSSDSSEEDELHVNKISDLRDDSDDSDENDYKELSKRSRVETSTLSCSPELENEMDVDPNGRDLLLTGKRKDPQCPICIRPNCNKPSRFDSSFCSDACGVATVEVDLLRSFEYSTEMHPYILRN